MEKQSKPVIVRVYHTHVQPQMTAFWKYTEASLKRFKLHAQDRLLDHRWKSTRKGQFQLYFAMRE
jgi:hypothetical protein